MMVAFLVLQHRAHNLAGRIDEEARRARRMIDHVGDRSVARDQKVTHSSVHVARGD
jgi:hypothetical protein